jgi:hypothetical protein
MDGLNFTGETRKPVGIRPIRRSNEGIEAQLVDDRGLHEVAFHLRYKAYRSYQYISDRPDQLFSDRYDEQSNCRTVIVFKNGNPAATVRVSVFAPDRPDARGLKLQAMEIFGTEIDDTMAALRLPDRQPRVMEIAKLARLPEFAKDIEVVFALYRVAGYFILQNDADIVFSAVRAHHVPMYRRFGFQELTPPRAYPGLSFTTALMACFRTSYDQARNNLPFLRGISTDDAAYAGLIAGERVPIFGAAAAPISAAPRSGPSDRPSQTQDALHNRA